jgi:hypothetical protein
VSGLFVLLSEADQKKFGCTDRLRVELMGVTAREQATLQKEFGYHGPEDLLEALRAMFDVEDGQVTKARRDPELFLALTWLALRHNDYFTTRRPAEMAAELADLDIQIAHAVLDFEADDAEGKGESSTPTETSTT